MPDRLLAATAEWGQRVKVPTLWMHAAFTGAGGSATLQFLPPFRREGHYVIDFPEAVPHWRGNVEAFFRRIGLLR